MPSSGDEAKDQPDDDRGSMHSHPFGGSSSSFKYISFLALVLAIVAASLYTSFESVASTLSQNMVQDRLPHEESNQTGNIDSNLKGPMNIVFFYADDWTFRTLGVINKNVKTPHIDEMAKRGMMFRYNCVTTSVCWMSRATLVTGLTVAVHKQQRIFSKAMFNNTVQWSDTLYPLLKKQGYHVGYVGKWHAPAPKAFMEQAWDHSSLYYGSHWMRRNGKLRHVTDLNQEDALHYLRKVRPRGQPFALTVSFFATHAWDDKHYPDQYMPQNWTEPLYDNATIPTPTTATEKHYQDLPFFLKNGNKARHRWFERYNTPERFQVTMKRYYRMATEVDQVVGDVISELKAQGVYDNTMLIFTTDNGMFHGEHGMAGKWYPHEESIRVPLIIQDPRMPRSQIGKVNDEFTLNIDLAPTILSAAGLRAIPSAMQGRDISQLYLNPKHASKLWRKEFFYEWNQGEPYTAQGHAKKQIPPVFALIRKDYKYFFWPRDKYEQIFRISEDPYEEYDLFKSTAQSEKEKYEELKEQYASLKNLSQGGYPV